MIRFIIKRKRAELTISQLKWESLETLDLEVPELENILRRGGLGESGYDSSELVGVELIEEKTGSYHAMVLD